MCLFRSLMFETEKDSVQVSIPLVLLIQVVGVKLHAVHGKMA